MFGGLTLKSCFLSIISIESAGDGISSFLKFVPFRSVVIVTINWDVVRLREVRRKGEQQLRLESGHLFYHKGDNDSTDGGEGFIINKNHAGAVVQRDSISLRVAFRVLRQALNADKKLLKSMPQQVHIRTRKWKAVTRTLQQG
ncbi:hypothetical protein HUJ05_006749 [Dendroctonus ponderosae]|nr:hypothetical protein HUJ05_006749 [Dendroctonus ponderosae]